MPADFTTVVVAAVSVVGALAGTLLSQMMSLRDKKIEIEARKVEAEIQQHAAREEREAAMAVADRAARTTLCAEVNMAAQAYAARCRDIVTSLTGHSHPSQPEERALYDEVKSARMAFRALYGQAQMVFGERTLSLMSTVADCLGHAYNRMLKSAEGDTEEASEWLDGPTAEALSLLRRVLRQELGVEKLGSELDAEFDILIRTHEAAHVGEVGPS